MSIPIERRELQDGWVLTCRSKDGGDLRLSDLSVLRENLLLSVLGSDNVLQPLSGQDNYIGSPRSGPIAGVGSDLTDDEEEESVLDEVRELILSAQTHGAWIAGVGGLNAVCVLVNDYLPNMTRKSHRQCLCPFEGILLRRSAETTHWPTHVRQAQDASR